MKDKFNLQQHVTAKIIALLESGVKPWQPGYTSTMPMLPTNFESKKTYRGINIIMLWIATLEKGYTSTEWISYKQAQGLGGNIKEGEKATMISFFTTFNPCKAHKEVVKSCETCKSIPTWKYYNGFNMEQTEGIDYANPEKFERDSVGSNLKAEGILFGSQADIRHSSIASYPSYNISGDYIQLPLKTQFHTDDCYYASALHELTHWTGNEKRLNRDYKNRFGTEAYAFEELIAEMGSAFLCASVGIESTLDRHATYIDNWLEVLRRDKTALFTACSKASDAYDLLMSYQAVNVKDLALCG